MGVLEGVLGFKEGVLMVIMRVERGGETKH